MAVPEHALVEVPCPAVEFGWCAQEAGDLVVSGALAEPALLVSLRNTGPPRRRRRRQGCGRT